MRRVLVMVLALVFALTAVACAGSGSSSARPPGGKVLVVTTTTQLTDFARNIGGQYVEVHGLLKPNVDPHDYEPSPADVAKIRDAAVLVKNGLGLEKWFDATIKSADPKGTIVDASKGIAIRAGNGSEEEPAGDPHIWHDPRNAKAMAHDIAVALGLVDPKHKAEYDANDAAYARQLDDLDAQVRADLATLTNRKLVTNHDAFGYYIARYGLSYVGSIIPSFDTQAELSAQDINDIVSKIKREGVKAVFSESSLPPKTAEAIGAEAGVKVVAGEDSLYGDTLGPPGSDGDTYLKMIRHNTRELVDNLR
jgi:ABC-type Zn uptake system ZnuABC Zn-binding protein ZnuA